MKKITFVLSTIILIIMALYFKTSISEKKSNGFATIDYKLDRKNLKLLVADTPEKWQRGLMNIRKLDGASGMIFLFPDKKVRTFWNKNTYMDLNLYWLTNDSIVGNDSLPSIEKSKDLVVVNSPGPVDKVIELIR